jgi:hypothetical protein
MDIGKIQYNLLMSLAQQVANHVAHGGALSAKFNPSAYVHNRDATYLSGACHHFHWQPPGDIQRPLTILGAGSVSNQTTPDCPIQHSSTGDLLPSCAQLLMMPYFRAF